MLRQKTTTGYEYCFGWKRRWAALCLENGVGFFLRLFKRSTSNQNRLIQRILISEPYYLGDAANVSVMLTPLKKKFPQAEIHLLLSPENSSLYDEDPRVKKVHALIVPWSHRRAKYGLSTWRSYLTLAKSLGSMRSFSFDVGFDVRGDVRNQLLLLAAGCRRRVGSTNYLCSDLELNGDLLTDSIGVLQPQHVTTSNLQLCQKIGVSDVVPSLPSLHLQRWPEASQFDLVLHTGGGAGHKRWPIEHWAALVERLCSSHSLCLIASQSERLFVESVLREVKNSPQVKITTGLNDLKQTIASSKIFIGLDSGPANIASLINIPAVVLFGPGSKNLYHPLSPHSVSIIPKEYPCPCPNRFTSCSFGQCRGLASISVDEVDHAVHRAWFNVCGASEH